VSIHSAIYHRAQGGLKIIWRECPQVPQGYDLRVSPRLGRDGWAQRRGLSLTTPPEARVARGAALFIDYGSDTTPQDSLRGILQHRPVHPLSAPGHVDLSVDVDFGTLRRVAHDVAGDEPSSSLRCPPLTTQRDFLAAMGLEQRVNALLRTIDDKERRRDLVRSAGRLVASPGMGTSYQVFAIAHQDVGEDGVAGFARASLLGSEESTS